MENLRLALNDNRTGSEIGSYVRVDMKKDAMSLNGSFQKAMKRYCLCKSSVIINRINFILPNYKSYSD